MMKSNTKTVLIEKSLYDRWNVFCNSGQVSTSGQLRGIYAGKLDTFNGPDFQGAEFELMGKIYRGDVEIHLRINDWYAHSHHLDSRYDGVVLHLVWYIEQDALDCVYNSKGRAIQTMSIRDLPQLPNEVVLHYDCPAIDNDQQLNCYLRDLALRRLLIKAHNFGLLLTKYDHDQAMYFAILRILGSAHNVHNFERLAQIVSWHDVELYKQKFHFSIENWLALYYLQSGLINKKMFMKSLRKYADNLSPILTRSAMCGNLWKFSGQRPNNSPVNRILGLAHFIHKLSKPLLYLTFKDLMTTRLDFSDLYCCLQNMFTPKPSRFWLEQESQACKFWGKALITEIIGNVIIPFFYKESIAQVSYGYAAYLEDFYLFLPATSSYGCLKRFYNLPEFKARVPNRFYINQALLHLSINYCLPKTCKICPLGRIPQRH
jgi:hypothetical protein